MKMIGRVGMGDNPLNPFGSHAFYMGGVHVAQPSVNCYVPLLSSTNL